MLPRWLLILLALVVTGGWAANLVVGVIWPDRANAFVNGLFAIVLGAAFTLRTRKAVRLLDPGRADEPELEDERGDPP